MTHRAESIIAAIVANKVNNLTTTGARVYRGRTTPVQAAEFPCLLVYLGPDKVVREYSQEKIDNLVTVYFEGRVQSPTQQLDTELNKIREEVTKALQADYTQGLSYVINTIEGDVEAPDFHGEGQKPIAGLRMEWQFLYRRSRTDPGA